ncbi:MAG: hypothetical protein CR993_08035 [Rhodobacterales bacterium]|nr:MAG: hypothetical protein CR993_08035 [Rhodobacterales bacterium]
MRTPVGFLIVPILLGIGYLAFQVFIAARVAEVVAVATDDTYLERVAARESEPVIDEDLGVFFLDERGRKAHSIYLDVLKKPNSFEVNRDISVRVLFDPSEVLDIELPEDPQLLHTAVNLRGAFLADRLCAIAERSVFGECRVKHLEIQALELKSNRYRRMPEEEALRQQRRYGGRFILDVTLTGTAARPLGTVEPGYALVEATSDFKEYEMELPNSFASFEPVVDQVLQDIAARCIELRAQKGACALKSGDLSFKISESGDLYKVTSRLLTVTPTEEPEWAVQEREAAEAAARAAEATEAAVEVSDDTSFERLADEEKPALEEKPVLNEAGITFFNEGNDDVLLQHQLKTLLNPGAFDAGRNISVRVMVDPHEVLDGELPQDPQLLHSALELHGASLAGRLCAIAERSIFGECRMRSFEFKALDLSEDKYKRLIFEDELQERQRLYADRFFFEVSLTGTEPHPVGVISAPEGFALVKDHHASVDYGLDYGLWALPTTFKDIEPMIDSALQNVAARCDALRSQTGNCVLRGGRISYDISALGETLYVLSMLMTVTPTEEPEWAVQEREAAEAAARAAGAAEAAVEASGN